MKPFLGSGPELLALYEIQQLDERRRKNAIDQRAYETQIREKKAALLGFSPKAWEERCGESELTGLSGKEPWSLKMKPIPAGTFILGFKGRFPASFGTYLPPQTYTVTHPFLIKRTLVTQAEWRSILGTSPSLFAGQPEHPVERIAWFDAIWFCNELSKKEGLPPAYLLEGVEGTPADPVFKIGKVTWDKKSQGYRLPTEVEWEFASEILSAKPAKERLQRLDAEAWHAKNSQMTTHPIGQKQANGWGLYDILGNVWEWCYDGWSSEPPKERTDPCREDGSERVMRGGSWFNDPAYAHPSCRLSYEPHKRFGDVGLRVVRTSFGKP